MQQDQMKQVANKRFLRTIAENNYTVPDTIDSFAFAKALLSNMGSSDGELRDELSYMTLASGIIDQGRLTLDQMEELLLAALSQHHLFNHVGEVNTDSVFMRSFSNLIIAALLYTDAKSPALPKQVMQSTKSLLLQYAQEEQDWRGYIEGKGWAHAMAHLADALDECAQNRFMSAKDRQDILTMVRSLAQLSVPLYHEEDMRLATVAQHIIALRQVDDSFVSGWLDACFVERGSDVTSWTSATNVKNFLRSLYFLLSWDGIALSVAERISGILRRQDEVYIRTGDET